MIRAPYLAAAVLFAGPAFAETAVPAAKPAAPMPAPAAHAMMRMDVNTATSEQLASVKGLDKTLAEAIVKGRPYKSLDDLTKNKVLPQTTFAEVKDHLTVGK